MSEDEVRIRRLPDSVGDSDYKNMTPSQRFAMVWQLTLDAWAFKGEPVTEPMPRHIVRVVRLKDKKNPS